VIRRFLFHLVVNAAALYFISQLLQGDFEVMGGVKGYLIAASIFGFLNSLVRPVMNLVAIPLILMTAGLFTLVLNMIVVWLAEYALEVLAFEGVSLHFEHFAAFFYTGLLLSIANFLIGWLTAKN